MKIKAAIYCRLSKEDIDKESINQESQSIINQTMMLLDYIEQNDFELYDIYKDDDYSGLYDDRPGFERLIHDAKDRRFDVIVAKSQSRFTRNIEHLEKYLHHDFPVWGIRFISLVDNVDTEVKGNKKARQINGLINEWYSEDLSESIKASYHIKQKNGQFLGSSAPYGYVKDKDNRHKLVPDPYAASIVKRIFHMYLSGVGKAQIGKILTEDGVLIPTEYKRQVLKLNYHNANEKYGENSRWSFQTIDSILKNEVYIGNLVQNKCSKKSYKDKSKKALPKKEWIRVNNTHEPIIDYETFQKVQVQLKKRSSPTNISVLNETLFARRIYCGDCRKPMTPCYSRRKKKEERVRYYICSDYKRFGNRYCSRHYILEETLKTVVLKDLKKQANKILSTETKNNLNEFRCISGTETQSKNINSLKEDLNKIEKYKIQAFEHFVDGVLNKDDYINLKQTYDKNKELLNRKLEESVLKNDKEPWKREFEKWLEKFTDNFNVQELTREIVLNLIDSIYIYENNTIEINYRFKFE